MVLWHQPHSAALRHGCCLDPILVVPARAVLIWEGAIEEEGLNECAEQSAAPLFCWAG